jgi:hypothetical protein
MRLLLVMSILGVCAVSAAESDELATPESFAGIAETPARSAALFTELGKVLTHPRCVNCHPAGDRPLQGEAGRLHQPPVARGADGHGLPAMRCSICHQQANFDPARVPGHPEWHLAPREMAWEGRTLAEICAQLKDPARNGGRSLDLLHEHMAHDELVAWGWEPGAGREPAPGSQAQFGEIVRAWIDTGAECPN